MENFELIQDLKLELIRGYEEYVRTVAGLTGSEEDTAREAIHTAICHMLVGLRKRPPGNPIIAWRPYIIRAAINALREEARKIARRKRTCILFSELDANGLEKVMNVPDPRPTPEEMAEAEETAALLWNEVARLSPREADVLRRWAHGSNYAEIAALLGVKPSTVRQFWSRGIRHLRLRPAIQRLAA